ncbi:MAG: transposase [Sphaerochaetaceae bacterium]|jgi:transposase|nr:transposase [Sphaerochaetaceae bacterium]
MYYDFTVQIPDIPGKIVLKKTNDSAYVLYEYDRVYDAERKFNIPKRTIIGKTNTEDSSLMHPNERYQEYFPSAVLPEMRPDAYRSCCLRIGAYLVISKLVEEYRLAVMLEKRLGRDCGLLLDLACYSIINEDNAGQYYPDFAFCHPLFSDKMRIYSDSKVSRFLGSITKEQTIGFLDDWNKGRDRRQRLYISYDSTNKNCQAGDVDIVEFGKAKDDKGLPVFNLALAFDKTNKVPLFYEEYPGSINDVSQFTFMVDKVIEYGYKRLGFILDRGYFSKDNIRYLDENDYSFVIMVKGMKALVSNLVRSKRHSFETARSCSIRAYRVYGTTVKQKLYADDTKQRYFHIYYNAGRQAAEREQLEQKIDSYKKFLTRMEGRVVAFGTGYTSYFDLYYDQDGKFLHAREKAEVIEEQLELCGYFCIVTSEKMSAEQALVLYKGRDASEKLFSGDKTFLGGRSMRVHSANAISAKIFIEFVALIIRNRIYTLLKEEMIRMESKPNFMTVPDAIRELEKIEMVRRNSGTYRLDHAVTKRQKTILHAFGLDVEYVRLKATEIGNLLADGLSMMHATDEKGDEEHGENEDDCFY